MALSILCNQQEAGEHKGGTRDFMNVEALQLFADTVLPFFKGK